MLIKEPTQSAWLEQALENQDLILLDHCHCELKAASCAISLMFRYPTHSKLVRKLTPLAQEELEHFELVNRWLEKKAIALAPLNSPPYASLLKTKVRHQEPERLLDSLLISALIEARSHERLGILSKHLPDPDLANFYSSLMASEARHYGLYWTLVEEYFPRDKAKKRLEELALFESEILRQLHFEPRIHS
jgi:tRNA-(ms[2]io[6]A)-hydroxylase